MKNELLPEILVDSTFRAALEAVLRDGETVEQFVEAAVRRAVDIRLEQTDFSARGEDAWQDYRRTGVSHPVDSVLAELRAMTANRRKQVGDE